MAKRSDKYAGLGEPEVAGMEGLFTVSEPSPPKVTTETPTQGQDVEKPQLDRVKSSVSLDPRTIDLLNEIKLVARKKEKKFVSFGELLDQAVLDLAKKMGISVEG